MSSLIYIFYFIVYMIINFNGALSIKDPKDYNFSKVVVVHDLRVDHLSMGLTNQLSKVVQLIEIGCRHNTYVAERAFRLDFGMDIFGDLEDIIDIDKTNQNIQCTTIINFKYINHFTNLKHLTGTQLSKNAGSLSLISFLNSNPYLDKLEFSQSYNTTWHSNENIILPTEYYAIHFRTEMDILMVLYSKDHKSTKDYHHWLDANRKGMNEKALEYENAGLKRDVNSSMVLCISNTYVNQVKIHFIDKSIPIVVVTSLGKNDPTNHHVEWILGYFRYQMTALGYTTLIGKSSSQYKELNAVADLKVMKESNKCIGIIESTFSIMANKIRRRSRSPCVLLENFNHCFKSH